MLFASMSNGVIVPEVQWNSRQCLSINKYYNIVNRITSNTNYYCYMYYCLIVIALLLITGHLVHVYIYLYI